MRSLVESIVVGLALFTAILVATVTLGCNGSPSGSLGNPGTEPEAAVEALEAAIPGLMARAGIPGLAIAIVDSGGVTWTATYGVRNQISNQPVTDETVFEAASLSKPVFTRLALGLVERGDLDLDTPIAASLEYERLAHDERYRAITPRLVLAHRSGLPNWDREGPLDFARDPGVRFGYSGEGYVLLQAAVEGVAGESLPDLAQRELFGPLAMRSSSFVWRADFEGRTADGHDGDGEPSPLHRYDTPNAAYSLVTTASDYARFLAYVMDGAGVDTARFDEMLSPQTQMTGAETRTTHPPEIWGAIAWGLGWGIQTAAGEVVYWHWGDNDTQQAFVAFSRSARRGVVYLTNSQRGLSIANAVASIVLGDMAWTTSWLGYDQVDP